MIDQRFQHRTYNLRRKVFKLLGGEFRVWDESQNLVFFSKQKAFKLREDIRLYADEAMSQELLYIQARKIIDFAAAYDVVDSASGQKVGALKRRGWKSIARDHWILMDPNDNEMASLEEDSLALAIIRRFIGLIPQSYHIIAGDRMLATFKQNFNPFVYKLKLTFEEDQGAIDRRLGIASAVLLAAIEGKQG